jgi:hypothetical protein
MPSLPALTNIMKGFRRGEVTVLTGVCSFVCPIFHHILCLSHMFVITIASL